MSRNYRFELAKSANDRRDAFRLRYGVFVEEIGAFTPSADGIEVDPFDEHAFHILAKCDEKLVGTCRVIVKAQTGTNGSRETLRLPGEHHYDYSQLVRDGLGLAEVSRTAVLPEHRGSSVLAKLWKSAYNCAERHGAPHVTAVVQVGCTDSLVDAGLVHGVLARRGMLHPRYQLNRRCMQVGPISPSVPLYSALERVQSELRLPPVMALFHRVGLRACGEPVFIAEVGRVGMAMLAGPETFSAKTQQFFGSVDPAICLD